MLRIRNLSASIDSKQILRGLDLEVRAGEVHAIMGPNGSGKTTFAQILAGRDIYNVAADELSFEGRSLFQMAPEIRAREGIFLAFQYPVEIPGVSNLYFLRSAVNAVRAHRGMPELDAVDFMSNAREQAKTLGIDDAMLKRSLNEGFSGGEKKRNEILQMKLLEPRLAILDESDSGLDIDALKVVADGINAMRSPDRASIVVTHYQRLLNYVVPDHVHVLIEGRIVRSGGKELALELEERGYAWLEREERGAQAR
jgi:Fe-S cluster assembly ATP-binding protein